MTGCAVVGLRDVCLDTLVPAKTDSSAELP